MAAGTGAAPAQAVPPPFAGFAHRSPPRLMGILNVTPDSFSGDGLTDPAAAIARGRALLAAGAEMLDIGGESTRPGATPVSPEEEMARILPVVRALAREAVISVDTRHAATMRAALAAGARVINDVTALRYDPEAISVVVAARCPVILMHMLGTDPARMQDAPAYGDVVAEVTGHLLERAALLRAAGLPAECICLDPGIGFGKTDAHNLALLAALPDLTAHGYAVMLGASRKSFIGRIAGEPDPTRRLPGSIAAALAGAAAGVSWLRVHDVAETRQALAIWAAIRASGTHPAGVEKPA
ncbi:MAG: dihydropteroate synthase [Rhodovarius sp.]|nr:dihydropteroate synthase [Rhodovarius sp.]MCX7932378.1 dihydropteroate synthase [Rhodovarius sp.]MDW8314135.1 dihydropteroate synthase [Rhodovarius sp.]